ncbi:hypothetical protein B9G55_01030 [Saccharibacillus sp. O16]|nr:hypothetical protein B9G55_01030 [Saccharibacillus sp. O16]
MKRKNHLVLFGILLLALINLSPASLPVTSNSESLRDSKEGSTAWLKGESEHPLRELEVYTMMGTQEFKALKALNDEYQRRSGAVVNLVNVAPEQAYKTYRDAYASGREPDVLMLDGAWVAEFAAAGRLLPADLYEANITTAAADALPVPADLVEWNGYRWAVPFDLDPYGVAWNPDRFAATSGGLPQNPQAWENWQKTLLEPTEALPSSDSQETQRKKPGASITESASTSSVHVSEDTLGLPSGDVRAFSALITLWRGNEEGEKVENKEGHGEQTLGLAKSLRTHTYLQKMSSRNGQSPTNLRDKVEAGELTLAVDRLSRLGAENRAVSRVAPLPGPAVNASLRCFGIAAGTERSREASLWMTYLTGRAVQSEWYELTGHLPVLRTVYDETDKASLLRWLPDLQAQHTWSAAEMAAGWNVKKTASREYSGSRSLELFYQGQIDVKGLTAYVLP